ncbi:MAG: hypothetical protein R3E87_19075 [Burkholderiaceae bacterium]
MAGAVTSAVCQPLSNVFAVLMGAVRVCSLGRIASALFEVGGRYRRSMGST